ncbi:cytochrome P450 [Xylaria sp. CBS 124048]|nr:cytochrome P450 [Xylaria sp. CBS 124048]
MAMLPELIQEVRIFTSELERLAGSAGKWGSVFQLQTKTTNLTFDIICRAALGMQFNEQRRPQPSPFKVAFMEQIFFMGLRASSAWSLRSMVRKPWDNMVAARNNEIIRDAVMPQIKTKFESDANDSQVKTIIDLAIKYVDKDDPSASREKPNADFVHKLIANLKAFLFAGHDTTASTICFMMKELQDRPDVMAKVRAEHDAVLGPEPGKAADVLQQSPHLLYSLPYTLGVIKETLRLHPLAGSMRVGHPGHYLTMPGSGTRYPTDDWGILMSTTAIGQNPEYWPRPNELIPERWTVPEGDPLHPVQANAWVPFSMGPRNCIGMELALIELRIVLVLVARRFEIEEAWEDWDVLRGSKATPNHKIDGKRLYMVGEGTVHPKDAMPVHVRLYDHRPTVSA